MVTEAEMDALFKRWQREYIAKCGECDGSGYVRFLPASERTRELPQTKSRRCSCLKRVMLMMKVAQANIPREFWDLEGKTWQHNQRIQRVVARYTDKLGDALRYGLGFVFCGEAGVGKTTLATRVVVEALRKGHSGFYTTTSEYLRAVRVGFTDPLLAKVETETKAADFVVLDELGKEHYREDEFIASELDGIVRMRRGALRPTILVTNYNPVEFQSKYPTIATLVTDRMKVLPFQPHDLRAANKSQWDKVMGDV